MKDIFEPFLQDGDGVVILDGGLATELERRGADLRDPLWSARLLVESPALIQQVHLDYFRAGADVATSASYQASFEGFARRGLDRRQAEDLLRLSVRLAAEARAEFWGEAANRAGRIRPLVAASVGCYGALLHDGSEFRGNYGLSVWQLMDWHRPRLEILATSGADLLACETIPCLTEAEALARLLRKFAPLPAWLSFSCRDGRHVCHGETLADCVAVAADVDNIVAVGINCTAPEHVASLLGSLTGKTRKLLLAYPNSGETWDAATHSWQGGSKPTDWGATAGIWRQAGAQLIGGCCRTTPETIRQIARALRGRDLP